MEFLTMINLSVTQLINECGTGGEPNISNNKCSALTRGECEKNNPKNFLITASSSL